MAQPRKPERPDDELYPNLTRIRAQDRQLHIQKMIENGFTREEAERHAEEHLDERDDAHR